MFLRNLGSFISIYLCLIYSPSIIYSICTASSCTECFAIQNGRACSWCTVDSNLTCLTTLEGFDYACASSCPSCDPGNYGPDCTACTCVNGSCNDGIGGSGECSNCIPNYFGNNCDEICMCVNGVCDQGINGTGHCLSCIDNYYGINCDQSCMCVNGNCSAGVNGNGQCHCSTPFLGASCDQRCVDANCSIKCSCDSQETCYGVNIVCNNDIVVTNQNLSLLTFSNFSFGGNLTITESILDINSIDLIVQKVIYISNSTIFFNSSSIITSGCINISNTNFTINLSNNEHNLYLLNSTSGCLNGHPNSITYLNQPKCTTLKTESNAYSLLIILSEQTNCNLSQGKTLQPWAIALIIVGIVIGIALIFLLIVLIVPTFREAIFPHEKNVEIKTN